MFAPLQLDEPPDQEHLFYLQNNPYSLICSYLVSFVNSSLVGIVQCTVGYLGGKFIRCP